MTNVERLSQNESLKDLLPFVSVDHDGVMADSRANAIEQFNRIMGTKYSAKEIIVWNGIELLAIKEGLYEEEAKKLNFQIWYTAEMLSTAKPVKGAVEFMYKAYRKGYEIPIISSRPPELKQATLLWYEKYMPWIPKDNIYVGTPDVGNGAVSKNITVVCTGRKLHIDDYPVHMDMILEKTDYMKGILISDDSSLDEKYKGRLTRVPLDSDGNPNFAEITKLLF
jgi:hypothetical protein